MQNELLLIRNVTWLDLVVIRGSTGSVSSLESTSESFFLLLQLFLACSSIKGGLQRHLQCSDYLSQLPHERISRPYYRGYWLGPITLWKDSISSSTHTIHTGTVSTCTWCPYLPCCTWKTVIQIILTSSKRTSAQSESPTPFLGFWVPTKIILAISPWFRRIAQQPRGHSEEHF
jgi:hypothetical protein